MSTSIKNVFKQLIFLILITGLSKTVFAQNKEVNEVTTDNLHNFSDAQKCEFKLVPGKGVLVSYSIIDPKSTFSFGPSIAFYDKELNKKWELKDYSSSEMNKAYFSMYYGYGDRDQRRGKIRISECFVDPSGTYVYSVNYTKNIINMIEIVSGKLTKIALDTKMHLSKQGVPDYSMDAFIDNNYFYLIEGNEFSSNSEAKKKPSIFIRRVKHGEAKTETFTLNPQIAAEEKGSSYKDFIYTDMPLARKWENLLITDNTVILLDNRTVQNKESKEFYRKIALYPLDGTKHEEKMIKMGEEIADDDLLGEVMYDNIHNRIYTFTMNKDNGKLITSYRCYDLKMELIWEKNFDPKLGKQVIQKIINPATLKVNYDNSVTITSRYGDDYFMLRTDKNGDNPEFIVNEKCTQGKLLGEDGYTLDCHEFNSLQNAKGLKSYIMKDKSSKDNKFVDEAEFFVFGDKVIFAKSLWRKPAYKLASFDMP